MFQVRARLQNKFENVQCKVCCGVGNHAGMQLRPARPSPSFPALSPRPSVRPSGAPIGQIRSLDRSHLLRFMHIFQKRKELPFDRGEVGEGGGGGRQGKVGKEGKEGRTRRLSVRPSVRPRICMHAGSSAGAGAESERSKERRKIGLFVSDLRIWHEKSEGA